MEQSLFPDLLGVADAVIGFLNLLGTLFTGSVAAARNARAEQRLDEFTDQFQDQFSDVQTGALQDLEEAILGGDLFDVGQTQLDTFLENRPSDEEILFSEGFTGFDEFGTALEEAQNLSTESAQALPGTVDARLDEIFGAAGAGISQLAQQGRTTQEELLSGVDLLDTDLSDVLQGDLSRIVQTSQRNIGRRQRLASANVLEQAGSLENAERQLEDIAIQGTESQRNAALQAQARNRARTQAAQQFNAQLQSQAANLAAQIGANLSAAQIGATKDFATTQAAEFSDAEQLASQILSQDFATASDALLGELELQIDAFGEDRDTALKLLDAQVLLEGLAEQDQIDETRAIAGLVETELGLLDRLLGFGGVLTGAGALEELFLDERDLGNRLFGPFEQRIKSETDTGFLGF